MFVGHLAVGFEEKPRRAARLSARFMAAQFLDLVWPTLLLIGLETVAIQPGITRVTPLDFVDYPITHSFLAVIGWAVLFGVVYFFARRYRVGALTVGAAVLSHWLLDFITHDRLDRHADHDRERERQSARRGWAMNSSSREPRLSWVIRTHRSSYK